MPKKDGVDEGALHSELPDAAQAFGAMLATKLGSDAGFDWPWTKVADHKPALDLDGDGFSTVGTLRGSNWRGPDCDDGKKDVHPGRAAPVPGAADHDCNGVSGDDERRLCGESQMRRVIVLGDSASAHFHVPWALNATNPLLINLTTTLLEDELDYPMWSWSTGFRNGSDAIGYPGDWGPEVMPVDSIYMRLVARNRCNKNFRENLSVNGARSTSVVPDKTDSMSPGGKDDLPAIVFYAMVGNDVINPHIPEADNARRQTYPPEFRQKVVQALDVLEQKLPNGSHVVLLGLEHGGSLWDTMQARAHPALSLPDSPVTYRNVWDLVNCLGCNPGFGWLDPNATYREHTSQLAANLSAVLSDLAENQGNYTAFDLTYIENPDAAISDAYVKSGGDAADLIEWVGGGHPSQLMHALTARSIWEALERDRPDILGPVNPNNAEIDRRFFP